MVKKSNVSAKTALLFSVCALLVSGFGITLVLRSRASPTTGAAQSQPVQVTFVSTNEAPIEPVPTAVLVAVTTGTVVIPTPKFFSDGPVELPTPVPTVPTPAATVAPEETFYRDARQKVQLRLQPGLVVMAPQEFNSSIRIQNDDTNEQPLRKSVNKVIVAELTFTQVRDKSLEAWATEQFKRELAFSAGAAGGFSGTDIQPIKLGEFSAYSFDRRGPMMDWGEINVRNNQPCPNGEASQLPQGHKPSPMLTQSGAINLTSEQSKNSLMVNFPVHDTRIGSDRCSEHTGHNAESWHQPNQCR